MFQRLGVSIGETTLNFSATFPDQDLNWDLLLSSTERVFDVHLSWRSEKDFRPVSWEDVSGTRDDVLCSLLLPTAEIKFQPRQWHRPLDLCEHVKSILRRAKYLEEEFRKSALRDLTHFSSPNSVPCLYP